MQLDLFHALQVDAAPLNMEHKFVGNLGRGNRKERPSYEGEAAGIADEQPDPHGAVLPPSNFGQFWVAECVGLPAES